MVGEVTLLVKITTGLPPKAFSSPANILSKASNVLTSLLFALATVKRLVSYKSKTEACILAEVPPLVTGESSFPSIFIGRPSLTLANALITSISCT